MPLLVGTRRALLGGGAGFDPRTLGNLVLWLDATKHNAADGDAVTTWADASGNGKNATQVTGTKQPAYKTGILNGRPVIRFDGGDCLQCATPTWGGTTGFSVFTVVTPTAAGANYITLESGDGAAGAGKWFANFRTNLNDVRSSFNGDVGSTECRGGSVTTATALLSTVIDTSLATNEATVWVNGTATTTRAANNNNANGPSDQTLNIGARSNAASLGLVGDIAEIIVYARALTTADRLAVEAYLRTKWGTP